MATNSGATFNLKQFDLVIGPLGFRVDALDAAGVQVSWQGDAFNVAPGADDINMIIATGSTQAIVTVNNMQSARFIDYVSAWVDSGDPRALSLQDRSGRTVLAAPRAIPRQKPDLGFSNTHNPRSTDIHCPNLVGTVGGSLDG